MKWMGLIIAGLLAWSLLASELARVLSQWYRAAGGFVDPEGGLPSGASWSQVGIFLLDSSGFLAAVLAVILIIVSGGLLLVLRCRNAR